MGLTMAGAGKAGAATGELLTIWQQALRPSSETCFAVKLA
jgi:hypothetical protein